MSEIIMLFLIMLIVAGIAFAPLGYFIYKYTQGNAQPFGDTEPHGDQPSTINDFAEKVLALVKSRLSKP